MKINKYIYSLLILSTVASCQTLEETYDQYSGDGLVRNVGKATDVKIDPAWYKLGVSWNNSLDPNVVKTIIEWNYIGIEGVVNLRDTVPVTQTTYLIEDINENISVEVKLTAMNDSDEKSLTTIEYSRPFTPDHEDIISFPPLVSTSYFFKDKVVLFFSNWDNNFRICELKYTNITGENKSITLDAELISKKYQILEDADLTQPITVERTAVIGVTSELVPLAELTLSNKPSFSPDFRTLLHKKYNPENYDSELCARVEVLDINVNTASLRDILNFPNLKTINFGSQRYMLSDFGHNNPNELFSRTSDKEGSELALDLMFKLNPSLEVNRYGLITVASGAPNPLYKHYSNLTNSFIEDVQIPIPSNKDYIGFDFDKMKVNQEDNPDFKTFNLLIDGIYDTEFYPGRGELNPRTYTFEFDIRVGGNEIDVNGFEVSQSNINSLYLMATIPEYVIIEYSSDGIIWKPVISHLQRIDLGWSPKEITRIELPTPIRAKYVRMSVTELLTGGNGIFEVRLGEFRMF